ncbi:MAG: fructose 1,6-bisphosphatase [Sulfurovum sp. PC08-66]|jgi:fructose-1,6-bisphosphatase I|nr:MAG: fructose 1,6-bisphosphatase [Sulfurovum sp. PC08-66]
MLIILKAIEDIAYKIEKAIQHEDLGYSEGQNSSGESQLKLDVRSDVIVEHRFKSVSVIKDIISEEKDEIMHLHDKGKYTVCYDPLDGSSLVDVNLSVGSIFGIYEGSLDGEGLVAAAYVVYGPRVELVWVQKGQKPKLYYAKNQKEFSFVGEITLNEKGNINAPGGTQKHWEPHHKALVNGLFEEGYRLRYSGGMVPDLHQILLKKGGLFSYPGTLDKPKGKLRQLFEVLPFALIYTMAGGEAVDSKGVSLLQLKPDHIHDTSPCFLGSQYEIQAMREAYGV